MIFSHITFQMRDALGLTIQIGSAKRVIFGTEKMLTKMATKILDLAVRI